MDFGHVAPAGPQNGLRSEKCLFWHHGLSQQTQITNAHIGGYWFESRCERAFFLLAFGALGRKSQRAQKGELCAAALAEVASLGVGCGSLIFPRFFRCVFCSL